MEIEPITLENVDRATLAPNTARNKVDDPTQRQVIRMYLEGRKLVDITEETGVPRSSIYWLLQKNNIDPQRVGTRRARAATTTHAGDVASYLYERIEEAALENKRLTDELASAHRVIARLTE